MKPIRIALTKGRLEEKSVALFEQLGYDCTAVREKGRRLILPVAGTNLEIVLAKAHLRRKRCLRYRGGRQGHDHGDGRHLL